MVVSYWRTIAPTADIMLSFGELLSSYIVAALQTR
jgi:hypothetical protein